MIEVALVLSLVLRHWPDAAVTSQPRTPVLP
jgi:hypothetical protein